MNIEMLRKEFTQILAMEERAKAFYDHYIDQVDDPKIKKQLTEIRNDEVMHIVIAKKLLEYVE
jgi:rubrerythrin